MNYKPTYDEMHDVLVKMISLIGQQHTFDAIVAPSRGGLVPGVIASHVLHDVPLIPIVYSSKQGMGDKLNDNQIPTLNDVKKILLIDDIADSGYTLEELVGAFEEQGIVVITATLHYKESSVFCPDYHVWTIPENGPWVDYPYEA